MLSLTHLWPITIKSSDLNPNSIWGGGHSDHISLKEKIQKKIHKDATLKEILLIKEYFSQILLRLIGHDSKIIPLYIYLFCEYFAKNTSNYVHIVNMNL